MSQDTDTPAGRDVSESRVSEPLADDHDPDCRFRIAATSAAGIECEHGYDVCPICDPCTCEGADEPGVTRTTEYVEQSMKD